MGHHPSAHTNQPSRTPSTRSLVGCDVQNIDVVAAAVVDFGARYLDRVYTVGEQQDCVRGGDLNHASLAVRFAGKEAVLKLIGSADGITPCEVEVISEGSRPTVRLHATAAQRALEAGIHHIDISLSHDGAVAFAVAVATPGPAAESSRPMKVAV